MLVLESKKCQQLSSAMVPLEPDGRSVAPSDFQEDSVDRNHAMFSFSESWPVEA